MFSGTTLLHALEPFHHIILLMHIIVNSNIIVKSILEYDGILVCLTPVSVNNTPYYFFSRLLFERTQFAGLVASNRSTMAKVDVCTCVYVYVCVRMCVCVCVTVGTYIQGKI